MKNLSWKHVVIIVAVLGAIVALTWQGKDTGVIVGLAATILGALGLAIAKTDAVKEQTNGNTSELVGLVREQGGWLKELAHVMAAMTPPPAVEPEPVVVETAPTSGAPAAPVTPSSYGDAWRRDTDQLPPV